MLCYVMFFNHVVVWAALRINESRASRITYYYPLKLAKVEATVQIAYIRKNKAKLGTCIIT